MEMFRYVCKNFILPFLTQCNNYKSHKVTLVDAEFFSSFYWWMKLLVKKKSLKIASQKCLPIIDVEFLWRAKPTV